MRNVKSRGGEKPTEKVLLAGLPGSPVNSKNPSVEKRVVDPSSSDHAATRYPIPSFFEYRIKPKEFDSL